MASVIRVPITVTAPDDLLVAYGAGALVRVERATASDGVYAEVGTVAIVAGTYQYTYNDTAGALTSWYRWRVSNAINTHASGYSSPSQGVDAAFPFGVAVPARHATLDKLLLSYRNPDAISGDPVLLARCADALDEATADLVRDLGYDFTAHAVTTWIEPGTQGPTLHLHAGVVSLSLVEIDLTGDGTWTALDAADWNLEPVKPEPARPSYTHLRLAPFGAYSWWPTHDRSVRLTGVPGYAEIPLDVVAATVASARVKLAADPTWPGAPIVPEALNEPVHSGRMPEATYRLLVSERQRFMACWI